MRPLTLEIEGFTAFREPVSLSLADLDLFAITGPTGAGKSSLIDAICYALYGRVPRVVSEVASCIAQGLDRMQVTLEFAADRERYRVYRETRKKRQGAVRLERWRDGNWQPVADRAKEVNEQINQIVGLDYDGFTRSVILPQGQFQEFLAGSLEKRRSVLRSLLRLDVYEKMRSRANATASELKTRIEEREYTLAGLADATPENIQQQEAALAATHAEIASLRQAQQQLRAAYALAEKLNQARETAARCEQEASSALVEVTRLRAGMEDDNAALLALQREVEGLEEAVAANPFDPERYHALGITRERVLALEQARHQHEQERLLHETAQKQVNAATSAVDDRARTLETAQQARTEAENAAAEALQAERVATAADEKRHQSLVLAQERMQALQQAQAGLAQVQRTHETALTQAHNATTAVESRTKALESAEQARIEAEAALTEAQRHDLAATLQQGLQPGDACPVCGGVVGELLPAESGDLADAQKRLRAAQKAETDARNSLLAASGAAAKAVAAVESSEAQHKERQTQLKALRDAISAVLPEGIEATPAAVQVAIEAGAAARETRRARLATVEQNFRDAQQAESAARDALTAAENAAARVSLALESSEKQLGTLQAQIDTFALAVTEAVPDGIEATSQAVTAALQAQAAARSERVELESRLQQAQTQATAKQKQLEEASRTLTGLEIRLQAATEARKAAETALHTARAAEASNEAWPEVNAAIAQDSDAAVPLQRRLDDATTRDQALSAETGRMETRLEQLRRDHARAEEIRRGMEGLKQERNVAADLAQMLMANKFQSFLQYEALRTLAQDGSRRLEVLSGGRYRMQVDEQGAEFEVVDQWNADQARSVRTLSGGETFLASLALSLALAESLPSLAAGRRVLLESIFLDEGFGSLDSDALDRAAEALDALRDENRMVCIITHLPELAQRLPARIVVTKTEAGSSAAIT